MTEASLKAVDEAVDLLIFAGVLGIFSGRVERHRVAGLQPCAKYLGTLGTVRSTSLPD